MQWLQFVPLWLTWLTSRHTQRQHFDQLIWKAQPAELITKIRIWCNSAGMYVIESLCGKVVTTFAWKIDCGLTCPTPQSSLTGGHWVRRILSNIDVRQCLWFAARHGTTVLVWSLYTGHRDNVTSMLLSRKLHMPKHRVSNTPGNPGNLLEISKVSWKFSGWVCVFVVMWCKIPVFYSVPVENIPLYSKINWYCG